MHRETILEDHALLKRFCKDTNTPINVFEQPYFEQRLKILNPIFHCIEKFNLFTEELNQYNNKEDYFNYYNQVKENAIQTIKNNNSFQTFNTMPWNPAKSEYPTKDFYKSQFHNKYIISIDMIKANFSALKVYDPNIFNNAETWEEFIAQFTDHKHIIKSKYIRQVIMGTCNPKRQVSYEKSLMIDLANHLKENNETIEIYSLTNDEIIIVPKESEILTKTMEQYKEITDIINKWKHPDIIRISIFGLQKLPVTDGWYRFIYDGKEYSEDFKKMPAEYYHQAVLWHKKEKVTENDLVLYHDGHLAKLLEPIFPDTKIYF
jgi:hypothetical protein